MGKKEDVLAIAKAQEIIMDFLKDYYRQDQISLVENILKTCPVNVVDIKAINESQVNIDEVYDREHIGACATEKGIFLPERLMHYNPDIEFDEDATLSVIIHEYAHIIRKANSQYGFMFEEGFVTIFAEACLINYKLKKQINEGVYVESSWKYKKAEFQIAAIMYVLNQKGMDIALMGEYIFGDQNVFKQQCMEVFGEEFGRYFDLASSRGDQYYNNYDITEQNSEILLTRILKDYIVKNGLDIKKYWDENSVFLFNRHSPTLANAIVAAGETALKETEKSEYHLFETNAEISRDDEQQERESRINRIRTLINEKYNILGKSKEEIYSILESLCSEFIQKKNSSIKENIIFIEEVKRLFPNIEEFSEKFIKLRGFNHSASVLDNLDLNNISFSAVDDLVSQQLESYRQKAVGERVKTLFEGCKGREDLLSKINELKSYESNIDLNQIFPNYDDFVRFVSEMSQYIPDEFSKEQSWNYQTIYSEMLKLYISKKEQELSQAKEQEAEYQATYEYVSKQYRAVTNENSFDIANNLDMELNSSLSSKQRAQEEEKIKKEKIEELKRNLELEKSNILRRNPIIRLFKRKQLKRLASRIQELEQSIQNSTLAIEQLDSEIKEIKDQIKLNDNELEKLCGLNLSNYRKIILQCKDEDLTNEKLIKRSQEIYQMIKDLNILEKEQYLMSLYEKNELTRQPVGEQVEMKKNAQS